MSELHNAQKTTPDTYLINIEYTGYTGADTGGAAGRRPKPPEPLRGGNASPWAKKKPSFFLSLYDKRQYKIKKGNQLFSVFSEKHHNKIRKNVINTLESEFFYKDSLNKKFAFFV